MTKRKPLVVLLAQLKPPVEFVPLSDAPVEVGKAEMAVPELLGIGVKTLEPL